MKKWLPLIGAIIVFLIALTLLRPAPQKAVVAAAVDLPAGHVITETDLTIRRMAEEYIPDDALIDPAQAVGMTLKADRTAGDLILAFHVTTERVELRPNERAVAVAVTDSAGLAGLLRPGDRVGVTAVLTDTSTMEDRGVFSKVTVENLRVLYLSPSFYAEDTAVQPVITPDPATGLVFQRERRDKGTVVLAVPVDAVAVVYDYSTVDPSYLNQTHLVNAVELLSALDQAGNASLSLFLMPKGEAAPFVSSGLWLNELMVSPVTPTPTPTLSPQQLQQSQPAPTPVPYLPTAAEGGTP